MQQVREGSVSGMGIAPAGSVQETVAAVRTQGYVQVTVMGSSLEEGHSTTVEHVEAATDESLPCHRWTSDLYLGVGHSAPLPVNMQAPIHATQRR